MSLPPLSCLLCVLCSFTHPTRCLATLPCLAFMPDIAAELIEAHAVDTYSQFLDENEEALRKLPPPRVAKLYYEADDM